VAGKTERDFIGDKAVFMSGTMGSVAGPATFLKGLVPHGPFKERPVVA
jgi:hypothetical protein